MVIYFTSGKACDKMIYIYDKTIVSASYLQSVQFLLKSSIFNRDPFTNQLSTSIKKTLFLP